jgi:hypothetical protein
MPLAPPPLVDAAAALKRSVPERRILWPTVIGYGDDEGGSDSEKFPSLQAIKVRRVMRPPAALSAFVQAAWTAQDRILVLDEYLFKEKDQEFQPERYNQILEWFPDRFAASDVRFLTKWPGDNSLQTAIQKIFNDRAEDINTKTQFRASMLNIAIKFSLGEQFPYVHDRFAIIDSELWHFGATVGGLHSLVNAATRGWDAEAHDAVRFFNEAWNGDADAQHGGRHG